MMENKKVKLTKVILSFVLFLLILLISRVSYASYKLQGIENFPESYRPYLAELKAIYPNWSFVALYTELDWSYVVDNQNMNGKSLIPKSYSTPWKDTTPGIYDVEVEPGWVNASRRSLEYTLDPRNFLNEARIFMFETLSYDSSISTQSAVEKILYGTQFYNNSISGQSISGMIMSAGVTSQVSAIHLASRIKQEVGPFLSHGSISGTYPEYEGYYNFYNIGATSGATPIAYGLQYAKDGKGATESTKTKYLIPWNTPSKAITGGAIFIGSSYINVGQNTVYLQKFDVNDEKPGDLFWHQYMTNVLAPYSEAKITQTGYVNSDMMNLSMNFIIPVYDNMPSLQVQRPDILDSDYVTDNTKVYADIEGNLNVRVGPSTSYEVLTKITRDDVLTRVGKGIQAGELWDKVILPNGMFGYVFQSYLKEIPLPPEPEVPTEINVTGVTLDRESAIILKGTTIKLNTTVLPEEATNKNIFWSSSDDNIASVDNTGNVTAIGKGIVQITVISEDGEKVAICEITVTELLEEEIYEISDVIDVTGDMLSGFDVTDLSVGALNERIVTSNLFVQVYNAEGLELGEEDIIGTGTKVLIKNADNITVSEYTVLVYGDIDGDGAITSVDLLRLQRHILEISVLQPIYSKAGNTFKNGAPPSAIDLLIIQRHILEIKTIEQ